MSRTLWLPQTCAFSPEFLQCPQNVALISTFFPLLLTTRRDMLLMDLLVFEVECQKME
jgi:hypothetical protein